jgi:hypothetical protein
VGEAEVTFQVTVGSALPADRQVMVSNGGSGTLTGLSASIQSSSGLQWLSASVGSTAPSVLTLKLTPVAASLMSGTYVATVSLSAPGASDSPKTVSVRLIVVGPAIPLTATAAGPNQVDLSWGAFAPAVREVRLERCTGAGCTSFVEVLRWLHSVESPFLSYQNVGLASGTTYVYRLRVDYNVGGQYYSNPVTAVTPALPAAPALTATPSTNAVDLRWTFQHADTRDIQIERCAGSTCSNFQVLASVGPQVGSYRDMGLTQGSVYTYRLRIRLSTTSSNYEVMSDPVVAQTPMMAPLLAGAALSGSQILLTWTNYAAYAQIRVLRCAGAGCANLVVIQSLSGSNTSFTDQGLLPGTLYVYRLEAVSAAGVVAASNSVSEQTGSPPAPAAPSQLSAQNGSGGVVLTWLDNATNENGYRIERCMGAGCSNFQEVATVGANVTTHTLTGLAPATSYSFRLRAQGASAASGYSNTASVLTPPLVIIPAAPSNLSGVATTAFQINLSWSDNASNENGFELEHCAGAGCTNFIKIAGLGANATSYTHSGLAAGSTHRYRIRAMAGLSYSGYSNVATVTTVATATRQIRIINNMPGSLYLHDIARLKLAASSAGFGFGMADLLTSDYQATCQSLPGDAIAPGQSRTFAQSIGANFSLFIQAGVWEPDASCTPGGFTRRLAFTEQNTWKMYAVYASVDITGHTSGTIDFTISGSYLNGTLKVVGSQNGSVFMTVYFRVVPI